MPARLDRVFADKVEAFHLAETVVNDWPIIEDARPDSGKDV
jgi:hypothetical protein